MPDPKVVSPQMGVAEREMRRLTRRSFTVGAVAAAASLGAWGWLTTMATREDGLPWPLRRMLRFNQRLAESYASPRHLAPTFPREAAQGPARTNGLIGLSDEVKAGVWQLRIQHEGRGRAGDPLTSRPAVAAYRSGDRTEMRRGVGRSDALQRRALPSIL